VCVCVCVCVCFTGKAAGRAFPQEWRESYSPTPCSPAWQVTYHCLDLQGRYGSVLSLHRGVWGLKSGTAPIVVFNTVTVPIRGSLLVTQDNALLYSVINAKTPAQVRSQRHWNCAASKVNHYSALRQQNPKTDFGEISLLCHVTICYRELCQTDRHNTDTQHQIIPLAIMN
jgi:hypothetical protein